MVAMNRSLYEMYFISSFVNGLKEEITKMVLMLHPTSLTHAFYMAKMQESLIETANKRSKSASKAYTYGNTNYYSSNMEGNSAKTEQLLTYTSTSPKPVGTTANKFGAMGFQNIKRLTYVEMRVRREKGLYYNCDKVFKPRDKCKSYKFFRLAGEEEGEE